MVRHGSRRIVFITVNVLALVYHYHLKFDHPINNLSGDSQSKPHSDDSIDGLFSTLQQRAQLELLQNRSHIFDTEITTQQSVLNNGYPANWNPCTLQNILESKWEAATTTTHLQMVVLGGSPSANGACTPAPSQTQGRYSDVLQGALNQFTAERSLPFQLNITNMAHGNTDSIFAALLMDEFVDPLTTDILLWEFAINDQPKMGRYGETVGDQEGSLLEFFFRRVQKLFASVGRKPPPIIMVYLWDHVAGLDDKSSTLGTGSFSFQWPTIQKYRQEWGWNIQVVMVGPAINKTVVMQEKEILWSDSHTHASCQGEHLISNMIAQALLTDMAMCSHKDMHRQNDNRLPPKIPLLSQKSSVQPFMFQETTRLASHTTFLPKLETSSKLQFVVATNETIVNVGKALETREDRTFGYFVPKCFIGGNLSFTLFEPQLEWVALSFHTRKSREREASRIDILINDRVIEWEPNGKEALGINDRFVKTWIEISKVVPRSTNYTFQLCSKEDGEIEAYLRFVVGLMS